ESESESSSSSKKDNTSNSYEIFADSPANANSQRPTQNFGLAVFKKDKLISNLNEMESISHLLIKNDIDNCIFSFPCPFHENEKLDLSISPNKKTKIKVDTSSENPKVTINIYVVADLLTLNTSTTLNTPDSLDKISETAKKNLTDQIKNYLNKTCKEFDSDIDGFGKYAIKNFWTKSEWHNYDWQNKYKNCKFDVNIQLDLTSSLLLTEIN
ncbi:MAG: Ger(x)C family spore germination C-terminal domain-containing protein, partial [Clostridia bacterium]|nr:Ger(x)C family spore germination C-terminal domain-containing protein [Clostridia bacterium]